MKSLQQILLEKIGEREKNIELADAFIKKLKKQLENAKFPDDLQKIADMWHRYDVWKLLRDVNEECVNDFKKLLEELDAK